MQSAIVHNPMTVLGESQSERSYVGVALSENIVSNRPEREQRGGKRIGIGRGGQNHRG